jgi:chemotaxis response regulator CheB
MAFEQPIEATSDVGRVRVHRRRVVVIAASAGGVQALVTVLAATLASSCDLRG